MSLYEERIKMAQSIVTPLRYPGGKTKLYLLVK